MFAGTRVRASAVAAAALCCVSLTACVNDALATLTVDGTLDAIRNDWIAGQGAPAL